MRRAGAAVLGPKGQAGVAALLAAALWLAAVAAQGFHFSPDSMSYASLARGLTSLHPFTSGILWPSAQPDRLQAIWPPLYPAMIAAVHAFGIPVQWSEFVISGATFSAAAAFGVLVVRLACGDCPWFAVPVIAGFPAGLYVAGFGWSEPVCLALLGAHYWMVLQAVRTGASGRSVPSGLLFGQALLAGLAYLDRYAAAPFLVTALLLPAALAVKAGHQRRRRALVGTVAAALGAALPVLPWTIAALAVTGHVGTPYLRVGAGIHGALGMTLHAVLHAVAHTLAPGAQTHTARAAAVTLLACTVCVALAILLERLRALPRGPAPGTDRLTPRWLLAILALDVALYTGVLVYARSRYFFDNIGIRLMAPALYPALLGLVVLIALAPQRLMREAVALPIGVLILWHGAHAAAAGLRGPEIASSLSGPWCTGGTNGDCSLLAWVQRNTTAADLIVGNASFTINFATGRSTEVVAAYPYTPLVTSTELRRWSQAWLSVHPGGEVLIVLDADTGPIVAPGQPYGPLMDRLWRTHARADLGDGEQVVPVTSGPAYRVDVVSTN